MAQPMVRFRDFQPMPSRAALTTMKAVMGVWSKPGRENSVHTMGTSVTAMPTVSAWPIKAGSTGPNRGLGGFFAACRFEVRMSTAVAMATPRHTSAPRMRMVRSTGSSETMV
ncbi:MAG: hypothetical protein B7Y84_12540 [Azorhizobium sp. 32-67-21]|nr:MAG: hypothetical protein B7Y84_12540 [Azorhizobium sp. 32-67-21]